MLERIWIGRFLVGLTTVFLAVDAVVHFLVFLPVVQAFQKLAMPEAWARPLGGLEAACLLVLAVRRVRLLGAVLLTGYLGGAVAVHVRAGSTGFEIFFPVILGALLWLGLFLIDPLVRGLFSSVEKA